MTNKEAMTNEEAIEVLKANYPDARYELLREAVDLAVEVLSEKSCTLPDAREGRLVYESDVIDLLDEGWKKGIYPTASNIHALPSVQIGVDFVYCDDDKHDNQVNSVELEQCDFCESHGLEAGDTLYMNVDYRDGRKGLQSIRDIKHCPICGRKLD